MRLSNLRYAMDVRGSVHDRAIALRDAVLARSVTELENEQVAEAATRSGQITTIIEAVADVARTTAESVHDSRRATEELAGVSARLELVAGFRF